MNALLAELKRRNIFRVAGVYAVVGWLIMQLGIALETSLNLPDWFDTFLTTLVLVGFPIAMILAWAFELTPDGVKRTKTGTHDEGAADQKGRKFDIAILVGLALVIALGISNRFAPYSLTGDGSSEPIVLQDTAAAIREPGSANAPILQAALTNSKSIAVLPFANLSPDPDNAFFADGMHDDLLTQLSKIADMHVISRTSVMGYRDTDQRIPDIARELGVSTIMEGAVQRAGKRVRINVQLIDAQTDAHLWAEVYNEQLSAENIFEIQTKITRAISDALQTVLTDEDVAVLDARPTSNLEAYDAYLRGQVIFNGPLRHNEKILEAITEYDKAIAADPNFSVAHAAKAKAELFMFWAVDRGNEDWVKAARESIDTANTIAPDTVETLIAEGYYYYWGFLDYARADSYIDRALLKAPNNAAVWWLKGYVARRDGRFEEAIAAMENGLRLDPLSVLENKELLLNYIAFGQLNKADALFEKFKQNFPDNDLLTWSEAQLSSAHGDFDAGWELMKTQPKEAGQDYYYSRAVYAIRTRKKENVDFAMDNWPDKMKTVPGYPETYALLRAYGYQATGEMDKYRSSIAEMSMRIKESEDPYPRGWEANSGYWPGIIEAMNGDKDGVYAAEQDYLSNASSDAYIDLNRMEYFSIVFAIIGEADKSFDYLEKHINAVGSPVVFGSTEVDPSFDQHRTHPRYLAIKAEYEKWKETSRK